MKQAVVPSQYLQIALDLARRIAKGELPEGSRVYGRSVMASEYNVSPETIRRALRLLADMKVVEVKPQSGAVVLSADSARRYIENFEESADVRALRQQLKELMAEYADLSRRLSDTVDFWALYDNSDCPTRKIAYGWKGAETTIPDEALAQIEEKGYARPFADDPRRVFRIGVNFSTANRRIDGWKVV